MPEKPGLHRRTLLRNGSLAAGIGALGLPPGPALAATGIALIIDPSDGVAASGPAQWALGELQAALAVRGISSVPYASLAAAPADRDCVVIAGSGTAMAGTALQQAGVSVPGRPEALALLPIGASLLGGSDGRNGLLATAADPRGMVYALTELADRVTYAGDPSTALRVTAPIVEHPASNVRSIARCFEAIAEDPAWFHDRAMWREYLSMLASNRFNRFSLTFGVQYNYPMEVSDVYLYFAYPFLLNVPGYSVTARELSVAERDRNLATVSLIGEETVRRGLDFQVGLWTHGYKFDSPRVNYHIDGITPQNHAAYSRDALALLLKSVPTISGITFRIHGESGIPEGSYDFWQTVFQAFPSAGRKVEIDMHAKGMDQKTIDIALATGMPVKVSPKYLAEHIGLPYQASAIRDLEMPPRGGTSDAQFSLSNGSRRFTRYSYADFLPEKRRYGVLFRVWPGTQRVLLWGDPALFAGYGRYASFCGADGAEWFEPLSFKGRMGSGRSGNRTGYADASLVPQWDWQKFGYQYRLLGRLAYNPDSSPDVWRRYLTANFGTASGDAEAALGAASRILPLVTLAHAPSVSNNSYWPEIYTNMSIVMGDDITRPYYDTPKPPRFGTAETFDPCMFANVNECAAGLLAGQPEPRYTPLDVAQWLDDLAERAIASGERAAPHSSNDVELRRLVIDARIQAAIGQFFAAKFRSGVLWSLHERTNDPVAAAEAVKAYRSARAAWARAAVIGNVYVEDISYGPQPWLRGHWRDRLPAIDADIEVMTQLATDVNGTVRGDPERIWAAIGQVLAGAPHRALSCQHTAPTHFAAGAPLDLSLIAGEDVTSARLHYRHVNQAEDWQSADMQPAQGGLVASIPGDYTRSPFALQYYLELLGEQTASLYPGLAVDLANQPYYVVRQS